MATIARQVRKQNYDRIQRSLELTDYQSANVMRPRDKSPDILKQDEHVFAKNSRKNPQKTVDSVSSLC